MLPHLPMGLCYEYLVSNKGSGHQQPKGKEHWCHCHHWWSYVTANMAVNSILSWMFFVQPMVPIQKCTKLREKKNLNFYFSLCNKLDKIFSSFVSLVNFLNCLETLWTPCILQTVSVTIVTLLSGKSALSTLLCLQVWVFSFIYHHTSDSQSSS